MLASRDLPVPVFGALMTKAGAVGKSRRVSIVTSNANVTASSISVSNGNSHSNSRLTNSHAAFASSRVGRSGTVRAPHEPS